MQNFSANEKLQEAVIAFIVNQLVSNEEVEELTKIDLDQNNDGVLIESGLINNMVKKKQRKKKIIYLKKLIQIEMEQ